MNLWIRSQDKTKLIKVVTILEHLNQIYAFDSTSSDGMVVGAYETKERALEVLDEIQNILKPNIEYVPIVEEDVKPEYTYKHYKSVGYEVRGCKFEQFDTYVYEMLKE